MPVTVVRPSRSWTLAGGERPQSDGQPDAEHGGEFADGVGEPTPLVVRLGTDQYEHVFAVGVVGGQKLQVRPDQVGVHAVEHVRDRPAGPVVEQAVDVEGRHHLRLQRGQHGAHCTGATHAGVDPAIGGHDQHRAVQLRSGPQLVQVRGRVHAIHGSGAAGGIRGLPEVVDYLR